MSYSRHYLFHIPVISKLQNVGNIVQSTAQSNPRHRTAVRWEHIPATLQASRCVEPIPVEPGLSLQTVHYSRKSAWEVIHEVIGMLLRPETKFQTTSAATSLPPHTGGTAHFSRRQFRLGAIWAVLASPITPVQSRYPEDQESRIHHQYRKDFTKGRLCGWKPSRHRVIEIQNSSPGQIFKIRPEGSN